MLLDGVKIFSGEVAKAGDVTGDDEAGTPEVRYLVWVISLKQG
jgi:hypothetical protein